jgi:hypothetical protein
MQGTLDTFSVVEVLQMLGRVRRSGTLHIECAERIIDVHFVQGRIAETRDSTRVYADTVLGSLLIKRSLIDEAQLAEALREQEHNPKPLGTILVERSFVPEADLRDVLSRQVANTLVAAKTVGTGTFIFMIDDQARTVDYITIDTNSVLIEVSSVGADYVEAFEILGRANTVLLRNHNYETLPHHAIPMGRDEFHVLSLVNDARTVGEIRESSHLEEVTVISILGKFCQAGVLLAKAEKTTQPESADELQAHRDSVWAEVSKLLDDASGFDELLSGEGPPPPTSALAGPGGAASGSPHPASIAGAGGPGRPAEPAGPGETPAASPAPEPPPMPEIDWSREKDDDEGGLSLLGELER